MKAAYYQGNRSFLIESVEPIAPKEDEVLLEVAYCGICGTDLHIYHGEMDQRVQIPQVIGHEASAIVREVGARVTGFKCGDRVVVRPLDNRGETAADRGLSHICRNLKFIGIDAPGAFQEYWTVPAFTLHKAPEGVNLQVAALAEPLAVACPDVRMGLTKPAELAVVIGGGPIGLLVALVAREAGARVLLSEVNPFRIEFARNLNIETINPNETGLQKLCVDYSHGSGADIVFEVSGSRAAALSMTGILAPRGRIVVVAIYPKPVEINLFQFFWKELSLQGARVYEPEDFENALRLMANGTLPLEQLITRVAPLEHLPEAIEATDRDPDAIKTLIACRPMDQKSD